MYLLTVVCNILWVDSKYRLINGLISSSVSLNMSHLINHRKRGVLKSPTTVTDLSSPCCSVKFSFTILDILLHTCKFRIALLSA